MKQPWRLSRIEVACVVVMLVAIGTTRWLLNRQPSKPAGTDRVPVSAAAVADPVDRDPAPTAGDRARPDDAASGVDDTCDSFDDSSADNTEAVPAVPDVATNEPPQGNLLPSTPFAQRRHADSGRGQRAAPARGSEGKKKNTDAPAAPAEERLRAFEAAIARNADEQGIRRALQSMDGEDIPALLERVANMEWGPQANMVFCEVMARWAALDPLAAVKYAGELEGHDIRRGTFQAVFNSWIRTDRDAAFAWFAGNPAVDADVMVPGIVSLFQQTMRSDPGWAFDHVWSLSDADVKRRIVFPLVSQMSRSMKSDEITALYARLENPIDRGLMAEAMVSTWAVYQPQLAAEWAVALADPDARNRAIDQLVGSWGKNEPKAAADWALQLVDPSLRSRALGKVTSAWVNVDPMGASEWLYQFEPSPALDPAIRSLVRGTAAKDPANAITWAATLSKPADRQSVVFDVAKQWVEKDPAAAARYVYASDLPVPMKNRLISRANALIAQQGVKP